MGASATDPETLSVARALLLDRAAARAVEHLDGAGVRSILLKGAAIANWLYTDGSVRSYRDVDLLVSPADFERATMLLGELGYVPLLQGAHSSELGPRELDLIGPGNVLIDLHHGLIGASGAPQHCWEVLAGRSVPMSMGSGRHVPVLDVPARAMHLATHAAQNGPVDAKAIADLERGVAMLSKSVWREAASVAEEIGAQEAFAAGLRLVPGGVVLADDFALTHRMNVELVLRTRSAPQQAIFFERFLATDVTRAKIALLVRQLFPTAANLRLNSAMARRGSWGILCARAIHPFSVASRLGPSLVAWYKARRMAQAVVPLEGDGKYATHRGAGDPPAPAL